ncbi:MAG TPA: SAM-dependent methyltransferase [Herpetosiphonaceae bacterium]
MADPQDRGATIPGTFSAVNYGDASRIATPADHERARMIMEHRKFAYKGMLAIRAASALAGQIYAEHGLEAAMDLASSVPEEDYLHDYLPNAPILYNDIDPFVIAWSRQLLGDRPNIAYTNEDVRNIQQILAVAAQHFGAARRIGVHATGLWYFIESDEEIQAITQATFDFAAPGSLKTVTGWDDPGDQGTTAIKKGYQQSGQTLYPRSAAQITELMRPWQPYQGGLMPTEQFFRQHGRYRQLDTEENQNKIGFAGLFIRP